MHTLPIMKLRPPFAIATVEFATSGKNTEARRRRLTTLETRMQLRNGVVCVDVAVLETDSEEDTRRKRADPELRGQCKLVGVLCLGKPWSSTKADCTKRTTGSLKAAWRVWEQLHPDDYLSGYLHVTQGLGPAGMIWQYPGISAHRFNPPLIVSTPPMRDFRGTGGATVLP